MSEYPYAKRFFCDSSFWNTPIPSDYRICERNEYYKQLLHENTERSNFNINIDRWTIPVYYADSSTPLRKLNPKITRCFLSQGHYLASKPYLNDRHPYGIHPSASTGVPIPDGAVPDAEWDAHISIVDVERDTVYDLWQACPGENGVWETNSAISYGLNGKGVFQLDEFSHVHDGESIHYYGPCRASGVPAVAGLIMHHEITSGNIPHKLAFAFSVNALQEFISPPAIWTDGWQPGGIPEGILLQLNPDLDLSSFGLSEAGFVIAKALQMYGAVLVDNCDGATLYAEGLTIPDLSWEGVLDETTIGGLGFEHFRFIEQGRVYQKGSHPIYHNGLSTKYYDYLKVSSSLQS